jgi:RNA polymerase sigma-70 factor (ECF subfamily)
MQEGSMDQAQALPQHLLAHSDFVRALAWHLLRDEQATEDVVQETWLSALHSPPQDAGTVRAWLARVTRNHVFQRRRAQLRRAEHESRVVERDRAPSTAEIFEREAARKSVVDAVVNLHEPYRSTILLRFYEDLPLREVARRLDVPLETVRTRQKRGLQLLRQRLDREHGERSSWSLALAPLAIAPDSSSGAALAESTRIATAFAEFLARFKLVGTTVVAALLLWTVWFVATRGSERLTLATPALAADSAPSPLQRSLAELAGDRPIPRAEQRQERLAAAEARTAASTASAPATTSVSGRVLGEDDLAISGARVVAFGSLRPRIVGGHAIDALGETRTDATGAFELRDLPSTFFLHAMHGDSVAGAGFAAELDAPSDLTGIELHVLPAIAVAGRVLDPEGSAVADAIVKVKSHDRRGRGRSAGIQGASYRALIEHEVATARDGSFRIDGIPRSPHVATILREGFLPGLRDIDGPATSLAIELQRGMELSVHVQGPAGEAVSNASVQICTQGVLPQWHRTNADGWVTLSPVPSNLHASLRVEARGYARHVTPPFELSPERPSIALTLAEPQSIRGTLVAADGSPIGDATIAALLAVPKELPWTKMNFRKLDPMLMLELARTDALGRFELNSLCEGTFDLHATLPGASQPEVFASASSGDSAVRLVAGAKDTGAILVHGHVTDGITQAPIGSFFISAHQESADPSWPAQSRAVQDALGAYELRVPARGRWTIAVRAADHAPWFSPPQELSGDAELDIALLPQRDLRVRVVDQRGERVRRARLICRTPEGAPVATMISTDYWLDSVPIGPDGEVLLANLPAAPIDIEVRLPELQSLAPFRFDLRQEVNGPREIVIPLDLRGPRSDVEIELAPAPSSAETGARVLIEALDLHGTPNASFAVRCVGGRWSFDKPLDYQIVRYSEHGPVRDKSLEHAPRDPLGADQIATIADASAPVWRVPLPMAPGRIRVTQEGATPVEMPLPPAGRGDPMRRVLVQLER